jgi:hypothetical protein
MDLDRWVNDNNPDEQLQYSKGWWDYIELIRRLMYKLERNETTCFPVPEAHSPWVRFPSPSPPSLRCLGCLGCLSRPSCGLARPGHDLSTSGCS